MNKQQVLVPLLAAVAVLACSGTTAPDPTVVGTYQLKSIEGEILPCEVHHAPPIQVVSGRIELRSDGRFYREFAEEIFRDGEWQPNGLHGQEGECEVTGATVRFRKLEHPYEGTLVGNALTVDRPYRQMRFEK